MSGEESKPIGTHSKNPLAKARAFLGLIRIDYSLLIASALIVSGVLAGDLSGLQFEYLVGCLAVFALAMATYAINDYYDYDADRVNNRADRPLARGLLKRKTGRDLAIVFYALALLISMFLNAGATTLVALLALATFLYSLGLKRALVLKNLIAALCISIVIILGSLISDREIEPLAAHFAFLGFAIVMALEAMKDIYDVEGDRAKGVETIATRFSALAAARVSALFYALAIILVALPFFANVDARLFGDWVFFCALMPAVAACAWIARSLLKDQNRDNVERMRKALSLVMALGMAAYVIGVIF